MGFLFKLILGLVLLTPVALAVLVWSSLSATPSVATASVLSAADIARARTFLHRNDPRRLPAGASRDLVADEQDLTLATNYLLQQWVEGGAEVRVTPDAAQARLSAALPGLSDRRFLNVTLRFGTDQGRPRLHDALLGGHRLPAAPIDFVVREWLLPMLAPDAMRIAQRVVQDLSLGDGRLQITMHWHPELFNEIRRRVFTEEDRAAMAAYHLRLTELTSGQRLRGSLMQVLGPMFSLAELRSEVGDPVVENRALLLVLGSWASGRGTGALLPVTDGRAGPFRLRLHRRQDLAQHFLSSAALAAGGDATLSDAVGLFKEMRDAGAGSGFSFTDIAADRAGTRFGELATADASTASRLQRLLAGGLPEDAIMPMVNDLPEHIPEAEFRRRFDSIGSPAYQAVMQEIETRIRTTRVYRN